jgi:hypothetical protein
MNLFNDLDYPEPLQPVEQWNVKDSSKMECFMTCPRKYFYQYILGWRSNIPNLHLGFGTAWHLATEHLALQLPNLTKDDVDEAHAMFLESYREGFSKDWDMENAPKNPAFAKLALKDLAERLTREQIKVLFTEVPGTVGIDVGEVIHFKMDLIAEGLDGHKFEGRKFIIDWKTASSISASWSAQWDNAIQPKTYIHAMNALFGPEAVAGCIMYGTAFRKTKGAGFMEKHIGSTPNAMRNWLWNMRYYFKWLQQNHEALAKASPDDEVMEAFPMNPTQCSGRYGVCRFNSICSQCTNPIKIAGQCPTDMEVEHWDPRDREEDAKVVMEGKELVEK